MQTFQAVRETRKDFPKCVASGQHSTASCAKASAAKIGATAACEATSKIFRMRTTKMCGDAGEVAYSYALGGEDQSNHTKQVAEVVQSFTAQPKWTSQTVWPVAVQLGELSSKATPPESAMINTLNKPIVQIAASALPGGGNALMVAQTVIQGIQAFSSIMGNGGADTDELAQAISAGFTAVMSRLDEIEELINTRFDELHEKLDRQHAAVLDSVRECIEAGHTVLWYAMNHHERVMKELQNTREDVRRVATQVNRSHASIAANLADMRFHTITQLVYECRYSDNPASFLPRLHHCLEMVACSRHMIGADLVDAPLEAQLEAMKRPGWGRTLPALLAHHTGLHLDDGTVWSPDVYNLLLEQIELAGGTPNVHNTGWDALVRHLQTWTPVQPSGSGFEAAKQAFMRERYAEGGLRRRNSTNKFLLDAAVHRMKDIAAAATFQCYTESLTAIKENRSTTFVGRPLCEHRNSEGALMDIFIRGEEVIYFCGGGPGSGPFGWKLPHERCAITNQWSKFDGVSSHAEWVETLKFESTRNPGDAARAACDGVRSSLDAILANLPTTTSFVHPVVYNTVAGCPAGPQINNPMHPDALEELERGIVPACLDDPVLLEYLENSGRLCVKLCVNFQKDEQRAILELLLEDCDTRESVVLKSFNAKSYVSILSTDHGHSEADWLAGFLFAAPVASASDVMRVRFLNYNFQGHRGPIEYTYVFPRVGEHANKRAGPSSKLSCDTCIRLLKACAAPPSSPALLNRMKSEAAAWKRTLEDAWISSREFSELEMQQKLAAAVKKEASLLLTNEDCTPLGV